MIIDVRHVPSKWRTRRRRWTSVTGIVLHQTSCQMGSLPSRWHKTRTRPGTAAHFGIARDGTVIRVHDLTWLTPHGHGFNARCVGIELDGMYPGLIDDRRTFWKPKGSKAQPMVPTPELVQAALETIALIVGEVAEQGGTVLYLLAHRQSSAARRSDPGQALWQAVALPAMRAHGLTDGGAGFRIGTGRGIPGEWDARCAGVGY